MRKLLTIWKPEMYHGFGKMRDFFEGWYFKCVSADRANAISVIPGISIAREADRSHAFVMVSDAARSRAAYFRYPLSDFWSHPKKFEIRIGESSFSLSEVHLNLAEGPNKVQGGLTFSGIRPWPVKLFSPGSMGWYAFVPFMECYHGVLSFDHGLAGSIETNGARTDFAGGRGYIEKDWGVSMPSSWIWMQSNHFEETGISLFGSVAKIPWRGSFFTGHIFGLLHRERIMRFATYTGAKIKRIEIDAASIALSIEDSANRLNIEASRKEGVELPAPRLGDMTVKIQETLRSEIRVTLSRKSDSGNPTVFSGTGRNAGLEFVGDIRELLKGMTP